MKLNITQKDARTIAKIVAQKAVDMKKKCSLWARGDERLSWMEIGEIANKLIKPLGEKYDWKGFSKTIKNEK